MILYAHYGDTILPVEFHGITFSGGEEHVKIRFHHTENITALSIYGNITSPKEFMQTAMIKSAIDNYKGLSIDVKINLVTPYLPYSRSDRVCAHGEEFGIQSLAGLLNSMMFDNVITFDVHSSVAGYYINNFSNIEQWRIFEESKSFSERISKFDYVIAPDAGAVEKAKSFADKVNLPVVNAHKVRDPETGKLSGFSVDTPEKLKGKNVLIVDDICDGGGTFIGLAEVLREAGVSDITLLVSHGIYSKGVQIFKDAGIKLITLNRIYMGSGRIYANERLEEFSQTITAGIQKALKGE